MFDGMRLVSYCHKSCTPLMNIMRLPEAEAFALAMEDHPDGPAGWLREAQEKHHYIEVQLWDDSVCFLAKLTRQLSLGDLTSPPIRLSGGYTHRMFRLDTTTGRYAVKLLNPEIMQRPGALDNYRTAEAFEALLEERGLPILPALTIGGRKLQQVDGQHLYVFEYFEGRALKDDEITPAHCRAMGRVLAGIHGAGTSVEEGLAPPASVEPPQSATRADSSPARGSLWHELADALLSSDDARAEGELLLSAAPMLTRVTAAAEEAARRLPPREALCHNDMDPKNVLWQGEDFRIIDLECLGYADPRLELLDLAISWAGAAVDEGRFKAFMQGYAEAGGSFNAGSDCHADAALVYDSRRNYIDWLEYNARRALAADPEERRTGREQVRMTIAKIEDDLQSREKVLRWMEEVRRQ